jgi:hypothetical protein
MPRQIMGVARGCPIVMQFSIQKENCVEADRVLHSIIWPKVLTITAACKYMVNGRLQAWPVCCLGLESVVAYSLPSRNSAFESARVCTLLQHRKETAQRGALGPKWEKNIPRWHRARKEQAQSLAEPARKWQYPFEFACYEARAKIWRSSCFHHDC